MSTKTKLAVVAAPAPLSEAQAETVTNLVLGGDLSKMDSAARVRYYVQLCESLHLNPLTQPFQILKLSGKEVLYATKSCTEQLRKMQGVSVTRLEPRCEADVYLVVATVQDAAGRTDCATGAVPVTNLKGEALANAFMKAETKAKRRATLSICGLGFMDESELDTLPMAQKVSLPPAAEIGTSAMVVDAPKKPEAAAVTPAPTPPAPSIGAAPNADELAAVRAKLTGLRSKMDLKDLWDELNETGQAALKDDFTAARLRIEGLIAEASKTPMPQKTATITAPDNRPTTDAQGAPIVYATAEQRAEITRLLNHPLIGRPQKTTTLLKINKYTEAGAAEVLLQLNQQIDGDEGNITHEAFVARFKMWIREESGAKRLPLKEAERLLNVAEKQSTADIRTEWTAAREAQGLNQEVAA